MALERKVLIVSGELLVSGTEEFYGYTLHEHLERDGHFLGFSTLYRALRRLDQMGYLESRWANLSEAGGRPRRMYQLTGKGIDAVNELTRRLVTAQNAEPITI